MSEFRVANRYAKSLITLAHERGELESVHADMLLFSELCDESRAFQLMLRNPIINHDKKLSILKEIFEERVNDTTMSFFEIITRKYREGVLPLIAKEFHAQYNLLKGVEMATITTTYPLEDEQREKFKEVIAQATGKQGVELTEIIDKDLIGGYVITVGGRQIDDSLQGKLKGLKLQFTESPFVKGFLRKEI